MHEETQIDCLNSLFTMCFNIDDRLEVSLLTPALEKYLTAFSQEKSFSKLFRTQRPKFLTGDLDLQNSQGKQFLLIAQDETIALRGQIVRLIGSSSFRFVGSPWAAWMKENNPNVALKIDDFPILDSQMDQRFHLATKDLMVRDLEKLTEQLIKARDAADAANQLKTDLFAVMSHEMRTPLHSVISALHLVQQSKHDGQRKYLAEVAQNSARGLLNVINYALDYSKIDAGRMKLEPVEFGIIELVEIVTDMTTGKARQKGVKLTTKVDDNVPRHFKGDDQKIRQILVNLASNAVKFTNKGSVAVEISIDETVVVSEEAGKAAVKFSVSDTGCGISENDLQQIFEPFWSKNLKANHEAGTGLGLKISKQLAQLMHTDISVSSCLDVGSEFVFTLMLEIVSQPAIKTLQLGSKKLPSSFSGLVMLVDDNLTNLMLAEMILNTLGLEVRTASSGEEAVELARAFSFDLVLMDITMPGIGGIEATDQINKMMLNPPVIALTAHVQPEQIDQYLAHGFSGYLKKPMENIELARELSLWLPAGKDTIPLEIESSGLPSANLEVLARLKNQIGEANFFRVRTLFLGETNRRLSNLLAAWVRRDHESLVHEAHTLSSSVSSFGGEDLGWRMRKIEKLSRARDIDGVICYMKDIEKHAKESLKKIEAY